MILCSGSLRHTNSETQLRLTIIPIFLPIFPIERWINIHCKDLSLLDWPHTVWNERTTFEDGETL